MSETPAAIPTGGSFQWSTAVKIAWREMRSSTGKFIFVVLSVAIGVAALTGVRGFSEAFKKTLLVRARSILAGDLSARMQQRPTPDEQKKLDVMSSNGVLTTTVTETLSMVSAPPDPNPMLVSLKAVDPARYPFYGDVELQPAGKLRDLLTDDTVVVGDDLLMRLHTAVGGQLKIGSHFFRIAAVVVTEPDRLSGSIGMGPRVMITQHALEQTGLLAYGSRAGERYLFKLPHTDDVQVAALKTQLVAALPQAQIEDYRESSPALADGLDHATSLLSLMGLVAMVLGAIGVGMAMRAHLQQRLDTIAIMKSLGARSSQIIRVYLLQTLLLGLLGGLLGVAFGMGVQNAFPLLLSKLVSMHVEMHFQLRAVVIGLATGLLTTLLFTLPPLLDIRNVRPSLIFRRGLETSDDPFVTAWIKKVFQHGAQILAAFGILLGLSVIAWLLSDSRVVGISFTIGLVVALSVLLLMAAAVLALLRWFLKHTRLHLNSAVRHGLANLYRPGNQSAAVLAALGTGVMLIVTVFLMQRVVIGELRVTASPRLPNIFLVDITKDEVDGVISLLKSQPGVLPDIELLPTTPSRILSVDGVPAKDLKLKNFPRRMLSQVSLSYSNTLPPGTTIIEGKWWEPDTTDAQVAIGVGMSQRLGVHLGSHIVFAAQDGTIDAVVSTLIKSNGQHLFNRADFILPQKPLAALPFIWYGGIHVDPKQVSTVQRVLYASYPSVTVINVASALETVQSIVSQVALIVQFLAGFSIFAGVIILASSIAGTRYRRIREVVVLKTLGATRARIAAVFSVEFAVLGIIAGSVGVIFANLLTRILVHQMKLVFHLEWLFGIAALVGTAVLANLTGWAASHRILGQKPLEVLREE